MSILIPDMKMPPKGKRLFVAVNGCGDVYLITSGAEIITKYQPSVKAVELPPHGRLGDLDALIDVIEQIDWFHQAPNKEMVHGANSAEHQAWYKEQDVYRAIEGASTIIPADGGDT